MDALSTSTFWVILGIVLILSELVLPGMISVFLGMSALLTSALLQSGVIGTWMSASIAWIVLSILLIVTLRASVLKLFPGDTSKGSMNEDEDARGSRVLAVTDITEDEVGGQIDFRDAFWQARSKKGVIKRGATVQLVKRNGLVWTVELVEADV